MNVKTRKPYALGLLNLIPVFVLFMTTNEVLYPVHKILE